MIKVIKLKLCSYTMYLCLNVHILVKYVMHIWNLVGTLSYQAFIKLS